MMRFYRQIMLSPKQKTKQKLIAPEWVATSRPADVGIFQFENVVGAKFFKTVKIVWLSIYGLNPVTVERLL